MYAPEDVLALIRLLQEARNTMLEDYGTSGDWAMETDLLLAKLKG